MNMKDKVNLISAGEPMATSLYAMKSRIAQNGKTAEIAQASGHCRTSIEMQLAKPGLWGSREVAE